jgi:hypothetical protein
MLRHTVVDQLFDVLLRSQSEKTPRGVAPLLTHLPHVVEKLLTG